MSFSTSNSAKYFSGLSKNETLAPFGARVVTKRNTIDINLFLLQLNSHLTKQKLQGVISKMEVTHESYEKSRFACVYAFRSS